MKINRSLSTLCLLGYASILAACQSNIGASPDNTPAATLPIDKTGLDILQSYDRDLWSGPEGWSEAQWRWKQRLKWDRDCDYVADVETYSLVAPFQLVTVLCVPGAYQPTYYLYLFDGDSQQGRQLELGFPASTDNPKEVIGTLQVDSAEKTLEILTRSRGMGDCGTYRVFHFNPATELTQAGFQLQQTRSRACRDHPAVKFEELPKSLFDYKNWPLTTRK